MKKCLGLLLIFFAVCGCGVDNAEYYPTTIWDVYSGFGFDTMAKFMESIKTERPVEHNLLKWFQDNQPGAFATFEKAMRSMLPGEDGKPTRYVPMCYTMPGIEQPVTEQTVHDIYKKDTSVPMPGGPPHGMVASFLDYLAKGSTEAALSYIGKGSPFGKEHDIIDKLNVFWGDVIKDNKYLRVAIKEVVVLKGLRDATVDLDVLSFAPPKNVAVDSELVRSQLSFKVHLEEGGAWSVFDLL